MKIEPIKWSRVRKSVGWRQERTNQWRTTANTKNEAKRKLSYTLPIEWNESERIFQLHVWDCESRQRFTIFFRGIRFVFGCRMSPLHTLCLWLYEWMCFSVFIIPTAWLSQLLHYPIHSFGCRLDIYSSFWYLRLFEMFLMSPFSCVYEPYETSKPAWRWACSWNFEPTKLVFVPETERILSFVPFFNILFLFCDAAAHIKSFFWHIENDDTGEVTKKRGTGKEIGKNTGKWVNGIDILLLQCREKRHSNNSTQIQSDAITLRCAPHAIPWH